MRAANHGIALFYEPETAWAKIVLLEPRAREDCGIERHALAADIDNARSSSQLSGGSE